MATTLRSAAPAAPPTTTTSARVRAARLAYRVMAWLLVACILVQVFLAGVAVFSDPAWWPHHATFVHVFELVPILMLVAGFIGRARWPLLVATFAAWFLIGLQYAFAGMRPSWVAGFHALNAMVVFGLALVLAWWPAGAATRPAWK